MGRGARVGRVGLLAVAVRGVGGARKAEWDVGMFRLGGSRWPNGSACPGRQRGQTPTLSRRTRRAATSRIRSPSLARPRWDRRLGSGRAVGLPGAVNGRVRSGEMCAGARGAGGWRRLTIEAVRNGGSFCTPYREDLGSAGFFMREERAMDSRRSSSVPGSSWIRQGQPGTSLEAGSGPCLAQK